MIEKFFEIFCYSAQRSGTVCVLNYFIFLINNAVHTVAGKLNQRINVYQNSYIRDLRALKPKSTGRKEYFVGCWDTPPKNKNVCYNLRDCAILNLLEYRGLKKNNIFCFYFTPLNFFYQSTLLKLSCKKKSKNRSMIFAGGS